MLLPASFMQPAASCDHLPGPGTQTQVLVSKVFKLHSSCGTSVRDPNQHGMRNNPLNITITKKLADQAPLQLVLVLTRQVTPLRCCPKGPKSSASLTQLMPPARQVTGPLKKYS